MKYFCRSRSFSLSLSLFLQFYLSLVSSLSLLFGLPVLSRALKKRLVGFAHSSTLKRAELQAGTVAERIFIPRRTTLFNPWRPRNQRFLRFPPASRSLPTVIAEESSDGLKLLRRFAAYLVKRGESSLLYRPFASFSSPRSANADGN